MITRRPQISRRTFCVRCFTARSRVPDGVSPLLDTSRARWPRAQPFVHVHTFTECYTRNGSHDAWHACVARMTWRVCGSILISWWSGGYWATSQNSPYCCVSAHAPSPRFRPFVHPFRASSTPPLVTPARPVVARRVSSTFVQWKISRKRSKMPRGSTSNSDGSTKK